MVPQIFSARARDAAQPLRRAAGILRIWWITMRHLRRLWAARRRERRALNELDNHLLRDIGVTRSEANQESRLPFWRP